MASFQGNGEKQRMGIENMFFELFNYLPGVVFLAKKNEKIIGVMRMKSCIGKAKEVDACRTKAYLETDLDKNVCFYEKFGFNVVSEPEIFGVNNRYMLRDSQA